MEDEIESRRLDTLEGAVGSLKDEVQSLRQFLRMRFDQFFEMLEDKGLLTKKEWGEEEERQDEFRGSPTAKSGSGSGGGSTSGGCRGDFGLSGVLGTPRNAGSIIPTVSVSKFGSGENSDCGGGGSGGGGGGSGGGDVFSKGVSGLFSIDGASRNGGSTRTDRSAPKSRSDSKVEGGDGGCFVFSGSGRGSESGGSGKGGRIYFPCWNKTLISTLEELNRGREAEQGKESNPKILMFTAVFAVLSGTDPLVLRRPLVDIVGARLQIGMVKSLGEVRQCRACRRRKESSVLMVEDYENSKATQRYKTAQVSPMAVSIYHLEDKVEVGGRGNVRN